MALISRYGTIYGDIPQKLGRVFFVAPAASYVVDGRTYAASNDNDGLSPERALRTIQRAHDLCTANAGDTIVALRGTHTLTATLNISTAGVTLWGEASSQDTWSRHGTANSANTRTVIDMTGTSDECMNITASGTELGFLIIKPTSGFSALSFQTTSALDGLYFHDLVIDMNVGAPSIETRGIDFGNRAGGTGVARIAGTTSRATAFLERIKIENTGANGEGIHAASCYMQIRDSHMMHLAGTWATAFVIATNSVGHIENMTWAAYGTITAQLAGFAGLSTANAWLATNCRMGTATTDVVGLTSVLNAVTCYEPTSGGTLVVAN